MFWPKEIWGRHAERLDEFKDPANAEQATACLNDLVRGLSVVRRRARRPAGHAPFFEGGRGGGGGQAGASMVGPHFISKRARRGLAADSMPRVVPRSTGARSSGGVWSRAVHPAPALGPVPSLCQPPCQTCHLQIANALTHADESLDYMQRLRSPMVFRFCAIPQARFPRRGGWCMTHGEGQHAGHVKAAARDFAPGVSMHLFPTTIGNASRAGLRGRSSPAPPNHPPTQRRSIPDHGAGHADAVL